MMKQWMVIKVHKLLLTPVLLALLTVAPTAQAQIMGIPMEMPEFDLDISNDADYHERVVRNYFESDIGMRAVDYGRFQTAEGSIREGKVEKGLALLAELREDYPEVIQISLQMAKAHLRLDQADQALLILEEARKQLDPLDDDDQPLLFELVKVEVDAYLIQKQPSHALRLYQNASLKPAALSDGDQESYQVTLARLHYENGQAEEAYHQLQSILSRGSRSDQTREVLMRWSPALAESFYHLATKAFHEANYPRAQRLALKSYELNPEPVKYSQMVARAQDRVFYQVQDHFEAAMPVLREALDNMRYAIENEDYNRLFREYLRLKDHKDVAFFMNRDYEGYLPYKMQQVLREVEDELSAHGFNV